MRHGKYESPPKHYPLALWLMLMLAVLGMSFGGVVAYLSASADPVTNQFATEEHPVISVGDDYRVTVTDPGYAVYLRAAVVVNWKTSSGNVLAAVPTEYSLTPGENWFLHSDGFYYYKLPIQSDTITPSAVSFTPNADAAKAGYTLTADMIVQTVQAVGTTDAVDEADAIDAVEEAWGISASQIKSGGTS